MQAATRPKRTISFSGRSFLAFVLTPEEPMEDWLGELDLLKAQSPGFFDNRPVVLNMAAARLERAAFLDLLVALGRVGVRIIGVEAVDETWLGPGMPPLLAGGRPMLSEVGRPRRTAEPAPSSPLLIDQPLRSGRAVQHIGDVTIVGPVASGAEITATGSVHVYGALRGRVIAGSAGDERARIFCQRLEAEFVAINGRYKLAEDIAPQLMGRPAHIFLRDGVLTITALA